MKKLLVMILMVGIALPAVAEVELICKLDDKTTEKWSFGESAGSVTRNDMTASVKVECGNKGNKNISCWKAFISETEFGMIRFAEGNYKAIETLTINRIDGAYLWKDDNNSEKKGQCRLLHPAF